MSESTPPRPPRSTGPAWILTVLIALIAPIAVAINAIPTMTQGGELKSAATVTAFFGSAAVLVIALIARIIWRRSPLAVRLIPAAALSAVIIVTVIASVLMWMSAQ